MSSQIITYYIENMASKEFIEALFNQYGLRYRKSYSYRKYKDTYIESEVNINMDEFTEMCRNSWISAPIDYHKANLSSGALVGHSWHRARPSRLHHSLQDKVRECISTNASLDNLLEVGRDIMKHEYFMVATHDICESLIIRDIPTCLPPTRKKSISDFIFRGIPYDLKVSTYPEGFSLCHSQEEKIALAQSLVGGADNLRIRQEALDALNGWGDNRFYILVSDQDRWIRNTEGLLAEIMDKVSLLDEPLNVEVGNESILVHLVEV